MSWSPSGRRSFPTRKTGGSGFPRTSVTRGNNQSPRPTWDKRRQNADGGYIERQDHLADASQTPVASSSNERGKETPIFSMERDVKGKRKADEIEMTTALTGEPDSEIVESNLGQTPEKKDDTLDDRARNMNPMKNFRVPRNRTLLDSVKAHLGESAQQYRADRLSTGFQTADLVPSLLTRLSDPPYVLSANSTKARNTSGDCQKSADEPNKDDTWQNGSLAARHTEQNVLHHDIDNSTNTRTFGRPSSSRSQDTIQSGPNYSTTIEKEEEPTTSSKNSYVSTYQSPPISSASPILCQNSVATLTTVESNTMAISSYQCIPSRSPPVSSNSQKQVNHDKPPNQFHNQQISHLQSPLHKSIGAIGQSRQTNPPKPLACSLNSMETRTRLLARLETEKRQVVQRSAMDNNCSPRPLDDGPSWSSSLSISGKSPLLDNGAPLKLHDVLNLASDHLVSEESLKSESKLRARAQLRVRLAAEKRLAG
ncbi:hypothetical protein BYT27DRAFT_6462865 [Phlegmacium glaucopus]|nr:hypothetical protein BYT27DRAFT_6462865 [Phlegmacium glaucopus]